MPTLKIESINYVVTGQNQKILNFDLEQKRNVSFFTDNEVGTYSNTNNNFKWNSTLQRKDANEHGFVFSKDPSNVVRALYDVKDVALKSAVAERITNKEESSQEDTNIEMYFPHLRDDPLGFAQLEGYGYGMSQKTVIGPIIRRSNFFERKLSLSSSNEEENSFGLPIWHYWLNPYDKENSQSYDPGEIKNLIPTYMYTPLCNLSGIVFEKLSVDYKSLIDNPDISAETLSSITEMSRTYTSSYYSFLTFFKENGYDSLSNLFKPVYNYTDVNYNYIMEIPLTKANNENNKYFLGLVNADMIMGKNVYDDIYDTNVSSIGEFKRVREYSNIGAVGGKLFLTYFDDKIYTAGEKFDKTLDYRNYDSSGSLDVPMNLSSSSPQRDYAKIECIDAINRFVSTTTHKANLFSTKVIGLDELLNERKFDKEEIKDRIKLDVRNSIKRIVKNFIPAHTQYFDVVDWMKSGEDWNPGC